MKIVVRMAIVVAALLLVSNVALAQCTNEQDFCYAITATDQYGNTYTDTWWVGLCNEGYGMLESYNDGSFYLYLFGGGPGWYNFGNPMLGGNPYWTSWIAIDYYNNAGYVQFQGTGGRLLTLTGEGQSFGTRYTVKGMQIPLSNCTTVL